MKTAFITGSSRGIGRAIAKRLARDGFKVILHGIKESSNLLSLKDEIEKNSGQAEILTADLTDIESVKALSQRLDNIDVLVLNASVQQKKSLEEITEADCLNQLNCNFVASLLLIQAVVPYMRRMAWGRIITIGSVQEEKPHPQMLVYSASKAAQTNMVKSLSLQLASSGITVNNVAPGVIYTDRNIEALSDPIYAKQVTDSIPVGYYGTPEDCAGTVSLLASDEGRYITGQSIFVDGGKSVQ